MNDSARVHDLNSCGCCEGVTVRTPVAVENRPGLSTIAYRVGTHARFKASMLARLSTSRSPALRSLSTRDDDDFSLALLDGWALVADVLAFYQERHATEFYLRTATERRSILNLARLIGYELRPGVAASTHLAFTVEAAPGSPREADIGVGVKVQSIPSPGEQPQTFETVEKIVARAEWNAMKPRSTQPQVVSTAMASVVVKGAAPKIKPGDRLLIVTKTGQAFRRVLSVVVDDTAQHTQIALEAVPQQVTTPVPDAFKPAASLSFAGQPLTTDMVATNILSSNVSQGELQAFAILQDWPLTHVFTISKALRALVQPPSDVGIFAFHTRASLFGFNAPDWRAMPRNVRRAYTNHSFPTLTAFPDWPFSPPPPAHLDLDTVHPQIVPDSWVVVTRPDTEVIARVSSVEETAMSNYTMSAKVSRLRVDADVAPTTFAQNRRTTVYGQSEQLEIAETPITSPVEGSLIELGGMVEALTAGQIIMVSGELFNRVGVLASEVAALKDITHFDGRTTLALVDGLAHGYKRDTVTINANVALATHGETVQEVLGSGDASQSFQSFGLRQPPLTYVTAPTPSGVESTLQVRVNDVLWHEVPSLFGRGPRDRVFITRTADDGQTRVQFGDGRTGARLPTGQENVRARYRKGIGQDGLVGAGQLSLLLTRPLGVTGVINSVAADGGDDAESREEARHNAPMTVLTFDRIVSLQDYQDFARAYAGIAKALATWTWDGRRRGVFVSVAGPRGAEVKSDSTLHENLVAAMRQAGDPFVPLMVAGYRRALFRVAGSVKVDSDHQPEKVLATVEEALRRHFSFETRSFGQPIMLSEVLDIVHAVAGVVAVDLDELYRVGAPASLKSKGLKLKLLKLQQLKVQSPTLEHRLLAAIPMAGADGAMAAAELLTLDPAPLELGVMP